MASSPPSRLGSSSFSPGRTIRVISWVITLRTIARSTRASTMMKTIRTPLASQSCQCESNQLAACRVVSETSWALVGILRSGNSGAVGVGDGAGVEAGVVVDASARRPAAPERNTCGTFLQGS